MLHLRALLCVFCFDFGFCLLFFFPFKNVDIKRCSLSSDVSAQSHLSFSKLP